MCAGILVCIIQGMSLLYPSVWAQEDILGDFLDREVAVLVKMFLGCAFAAVGVAMVVYTPTLADFFNQWNAENTESELAFAPPVIPIESVLPPQELPSSLPRLPGEASKSSSGPIEFRSDVSNRPLSRTETPKSETVSPSTELSALGTEAPLPFGYSISPPSGLALFQTVSHDGPGFWRVHQRWYRSADSTSFSVLMYGSEEGGVPTLRALADDANVGRILPRVAAAFPRGKFADAKLPATLFETGKYQGAAVSATLEQGTGTHPATLYLIPDRSVLIVIVASGPAISSGGLRSALDASVLSLKQRDPLASEQADLEGYAGMIPASENPFAVVQ